MAEPIIQAININKKFKSKSVLEDITFDIMRGEFLSLLGPSGCGKTTILRMLIGIEQPTSGKIIKDGVDITHTPPKDRNIGIVFQNYSLFPNMDVFHNISCVHLAQEMVAINLDLRNSRPCRRNSEDISPDKGVRRYGSGF